jgi:hypothetical protein
MKLNKIIDEINLHKTDLFIYLYEKIFLNFWFFFFLNIEIMKI